MHACCCSVVLTRLQCPSMELALASMRTPEPAEGSPNLFGVAQGIGNDGQHTWYPGVVCQHLGVVWVGQFVKLKSWPFLQFLCVGTIRYESSRDIGVAVMLRKCPCTVDLVQSLNCSRK